VKISTRYVAPIISSSLLDSLLQFHAKDHPIRNPGLLCETKKRRDYAASQNVPIESVKSVCLFLGPYRNLTTLTASTLFLHPNCQVLNHASTRIFGDERIDFFANYSDATFDAFLRYAIHISQSGARGQYGGSITLSHSFDETYAMKEIFKESFGGDLLKKEIQSLVWKESLRTSNYIRFRNVDVDSMFKCNTRLRFLVPVRHPIDCAFSNLKSGHARHFAGESTASPVERIVAAILGEFAWIEDLRRKNPDRFFVFFEHEFDERTLADLASFLELDQDEKWHKVALAAFELKKRYSHAPELVDSYRADVTRRFGDNPEMAAKFMRFADDDLAAATT
jgi:hypothetical protein